nr:MFS transporter [Actinomycetota bacterium]
MRELLRDPDTRRLLSAQWAAQIADGLVQAAFANLLILEPDGAPMRILAVSALTLLPYSVIAPFMGVFVDRWQRRRILVLTNMVRAVLLLGIAAVVRVTEAEVVLYSALLLILGIGRLFLTTKGAVLPVVLHEKALIRGNALSGGGGMIAALIGGIAGVGAVAISSTAAALVVGTVFYAAAAYIATRISDPLAHGLERDEALGAAAARVLAELKDGAVQIWRRPGARIPLAGVFVVRTAAMIAAISAILIIKREFPAAGDDVGRLSASALALGSAGIGAFLGAVFAPRLSDRFPGARLMLLGFAVSGAGIVLLGGIVAMPAVLGLTFIGGLGGFLAKVAVDALLQEQLPDEYRGRGFAVYDILFNAATVAAALAVVGAENTSFRLFLVVTGLMTLMLAALIG